MTEAGRRPNFGTIGSALLWSPFYAVADVSVRLRRAAGSDGAADGFSRPYIAAVAYGSALYGFLAVLLTISAARRLLGDDLASPLRQGRRRAVPTDLPASAEARRTHARCESLVWAGSPLLFYMYVAPPMSHACSAFAVALFVTIWLYVRAALDVRGVIALGVAAGLMAHGSRAGRVLCDRTGTRLRPDTAARAVDPRHRRAPRSPDVPRPC